MHAPILKVNFPKEIDKINLALLNDLKNTETSPDLYIYSIETYLGILQYQIALLI